MGAGTWPAKRALRAGLLWPSGALCAPAPAPARGPATGSRGVPGASEGPPLAPLAVRVTGAVSAPRTGSSSLTASYLLMARSLGSARA